MATMGSKPRRLARCRACGSSLALVEELVPPHTARTLDLLRAIPCPGSGLGPVGPEAPGSWEKIDLTPADAALLGLEDDP